MTTSGSVKILLRNNTYGDNPLQNNFCVYNFRYIACSVRSDDKFMVILYTMIIFSIDI